MRVLRTFAQDRRGAAAIEFAIVAMMLILSILFIMTVGLILYLNQALDYATNKAARQIMIGSAQSGGLGQGAFKTSLCGFLPSVFNCSDVIVNLYVIQPGSNPSGYYNYVASDMSGLTIPTLSGSSGQYTLGSQGQYQYLQVIYPLRFLPKAFATMLSGGVTYNGQAAYLAISTAAFRNEQF